MIALVHNLRPLYEIPTTSARGSTLDPRSVPQPAVLDRHARGVLDRMAGQAA
jgi:hypothetical protein